MVKLVFLCRRRPDLDHDRYATLLQGHMPLALRHHPTMRRYLVNVVEDAAPGTPPLDSIGMLWFDSLADYRDRLYDSPEGAAIIARDVAGFMQSADAYATAEERRKPASGGEKVVLCLVRRPGLTPEAFHARWRADGATADCVVSLVERRLGSTGPDYDTIAERYGGGLPDAMRAYRDLASVLHGYRVREHVGRWDDPSAG